MRKGFAISAATAVALAVTATSAAPAGAAGPRLVRGPDGVTVDIVALYGSGCPVGSTWASILSDSKMLRVEYDRFAARSGGSSIPPDHRKTCKVVLKLNVPKEFTYAISSSYDSGYAAIEDGAKATVKLGYSFQNVPPPDVTHTVSGHFKDDWEFRNNPPADSIIWKPCGEDQNLQITSELTVDQGTSDPSKLNFIGMEPMADSHHHFYNLAWKTCP
ncbi:DUF4360 domain-containing protein [Actinomadura meridiana]|uniref:DUF4360 domain-containing protein n=1 Tax=Actinomadura meridiana TaxID=559626 RepID=A0ABP8CI38_9ACTN